MPTIARSESWRYEWRLETKDDATGELTPLAADTSVSCWLSTTYKGDPVTTESIVMLSRGAAGLRSDGRCLWSGGLGAESVTAALAGITTGSTVYEICAVNGERKCAALTVAD